MKSLRSCYHGFILHTAYGSDTLTSSSGSALAIPPQIALTMFSAPTPHLTQHSCKLRPPSDQAAGSAVLMAQLRLLEQAMCRDLSNLSCRAMRLQNASRQDIPCLPANCHARPTLWIHIHVPPLSVDYATPFNAAWHAAVLHTSFPGSCHGPLCSPTQALSFWLCEGVESCRACHQPHSDSLHQREHWSGST